MTRNALNDLHEKLCYGHDAEIQIGDVHLFIEWSDTAIEVYKMKEDEGEKLFIFRGETSLETVDSLFAASLNGKILNNDYSDIQIIDIE